MNRFGGFESESVMNIFSGITLYSVSTLSYDHKCMLTYSRQKEINDADAERQKQKEEQEEAERQRLEQEKLEAERLAEERR